MHCVKRSDPAQQVTSPLCLVAYLVHSHPVLVCIDKPDFIKRYSWIHICLCFSSSRIWIKSSLQEVHYVYKQLAIAVTSLILSLFCNLILIFIILWHFVVSIVASSCRTLLRHKISKQTTLLNQIWIHLNLSNRLRLHTKMRCYTENAKVKRFISPGKVAPGQKRVTEHGQTRWYNQQIWPSPTHIAYCRLILLAMQLESAYYKEKFFNWLWGQVWWSLRSHVAKLRWHEEYLLGHNQFSHGYLNPRGTCWCFRPGHHCCVCWCCHWCQGPRLMRFWLLHHWCFGRCLQEQVWFFEFEVFLWAIIGWLRQFGTDMGYNGDLMDCAFTWITMVVSVMRMITKARRPLVPVITKDTKAAPTSHTDVTQNSDSALMSALNQRPVFVAIEADQSSFQLYKSASLVLAVLNWTTVFFGLSFTALTLWMVTATRSRTLGVPHGWGRIHPPGLL